MTVTASRLTFRERAGDKCYQRQLRDQYNALPPVGASLELKQARVRPITRRLAKQVILKYEWLGTLPSVCTHYYGIFFGLHCGGVTCLGVGSKGANISAHQEWGLKHTELAYLTRGACVHWAPPNTNSKLVSWTCRLIGQRTAARLVIAYADTDAGEIGTIYQASNWICVGRGGATRQWVSPRGAIRDQKLPYDLARQRGGTRGQWVNALLRKGWHRQLSNPKYRYVYILKSDPVLEQRVRNKQVEYPRREDIFNHAGG